MPYIEDFNEFKQRMNCPFVTVKDRHLFENGGQSNGRTHADPPDDPIILLTLQVEYLTVSLQKAERLFRECQSYIIEQSKIHALNAGPPADEQAFKDLERFHVRVFRLREKLKQKQSELNALREPPPGHAYDDRRSEQRQTANDAIKRATAIEI